MGEALSKTYRDFVRGYLEANTWPERKDGPQTYLLDALNEEDKKRAEDELIKRLSSWRDTWPIVGLGHLRSAKALPHLYPLLSRSRGSVKAEIATAIWNISRDETMLQIVIRCSKRSILSLFNPFKTFSKIDIIYCLAQFDRQDAFDRLEEMKMDRDYLVSYNAKRALEMMKLNKRRTVQAELGQ